MRNHVLLLAVIAANCAAPSPQSVNSPRWLFFVSMADNNTTETMEWGFISHVIITPGQCATVAGMVQLLDEALQQANPDVENVTSTALRLGNHECIDGVCPCAQEKGRSSSSNRLRRLIVTHQLLEVVTRSSSPNLNPPVRLP